MTIGHLFTDSNVVVTFPENIVKSISDNKNRILNIDKNRVGFTRAIFPNESVMVMNINDNPVAGSIIVENEKLKAGVEITSDARYSTIHFGHRRERAAQNLILILNCFLGRRLTGVLNMFFM